MIATNKIVRTCKEFYIFDRKMTEYAGKKLDFNDYYFNIFFKHMSLGFIKD